MTPRRSVKRTQRRFASVLVAFVIATPLLVFPVTIAGAATTVDLGTAEDFVVLGTAVTLTDSTVTGDVGSTGAATLTRSNVIGDLHHGGALTLTLSNVTGAFHDDGVAVDAAYADFLDAHADVGLVSVPAGNELTGDLDGVTLSPGVYSFDTSGKTGTLTLDAGGDPDPVWILKGVAALTGTGFNVVIVGGDADDVFWWTPTGAAATLTASNFQGTILSGAAITVTGATFIGRALATDAVTMTGVTMTSVEEGPLAPVLFFLDTRMTGGGSVFTAANVRVTHGFTLQCDASAGPNNLQVNWGQGRDGNRFHLEELTAAVCTDDSAIDPAPPEAGFDTYLGIGTGRWNNQSGATIVWTFTDAGQPGVNDTATIRIWDADGTLVLEVSGTLDKGNHQAHDSQV